jgi:hypothetical protein
MFVENTETIAMSKDDISRLMHLPNSDLNIDDVEIIPTKPRMPPTKRQRVSRHGAMKNYALQHEQGQPAKISAGSGAPGEEKKPLSPVIRRSAINNLVGSPQNSGDTVKVAGYQGRDASKIKGSSTLRSQPSGQISLEN